MEKTQQKQKYISPVVSKFEIDFDISLYLESEPPVFESKNSNQMNEIHFLNPYKTV